MALPIYTHITNLKVLTKIFFKLSRPKGNKTIAFVALPIYTPLKENMTGGSCIIYA